MKIVYAPGATPLDPNELAGLIPSYITTQGELNDLERRNILEATTWAYGKKHSDMLNATFIFDLHKRMLSRVWSWAGTQRKCDKSIGSPWQDISTGLAQLLGDAKFWIENKTYEWDELGARFHHGLVRVHAFPNGNGRHARITTDILLNSNDQAMFSWGMKTSSEVLEVHGALREAYISALKKADQGDYEPLRTFVSS